MANLRITYTRIRSSTKIEIEFTTSLSSGIGVENVIIEGAQGGVADLAVTSVSTSENILTINVRPMVPGAYYKLILQSTNNRIISGSHGERFLEDGATNVVFFVGIIEDNEIRDNILANITGIYNKEPGSRIFDFIEASAKEIETSANAADEVKSANYVSIEVADEEITRGSGPFDRFANEGVFQLLNVRSTINGITTDAILNYAEFPAAPVSLQQIFVDKEIISNTTSGNNFVGLEITLSKETIIQVTSIKLTRGSTTYIYDINQYKYGILDSKYDPEHSYSALDLAPNQIRLNGSAIGPSFPFPEGSDIFTISYYYKKEGRIINANDVRITTDVDIIRESAPAVATSFFLDNAPIVDTTGNIPTRNGVQWLDPAQNFDPTKKHPAFITEIPFNASSLPNVVGQYSIDYNTGQVFVFGVDGTGTDGTTVIPPVASYTTQKTYQEGLDYRFFADLNEVASLPNRDLRGNPATIWYEYEDTYADGVDFEFASHIEIIDERVNNNLIETIGIRTQNYPVNEVFRIYNETTGEIYTPTRISGNAVYFDAVTPPNIVEVERERAEFQSVIQSQLVIEDRITIPSSSFIAFKIQVGDGNIGTATGNFIGASFNSSLVFSDTDIFKREFYYDPEDDLDDNLDRLQQIGDYMVDYANGLAYLAVIPTADTSIGDATYKKSILKPKNDHIIRANDVYRSPQIGQVTKTYNIDQVEDTTISISNLEQVGERTIADASGTYIPIVVSGGSVTVRNDVIRLTHIFQVVDLQTSHDPIDFGVGATVSSTSGNIINLAANGVSIFDNNDGGNLLIKSDGSRVYVDAKRLEDLHQRGLAVLVSATYVRDNTTNLNYFSLGADGYVDAVNNRIYLPSAANWALGKEIIAEYKARLRDGAAVLVDYTVGDMFVDYAYTTDEILVTYEYGDNVLDWSISNTLSAGDTYYVSYRYGALRNSLRDNFGILTGLEELATIPDELEREVYRNAITGSLQAFPKGPTIPALEDLVSAFTQIDPVLTESVFLEWILGRDYLYLQEMKLNADSESNLPTYAPGKFGNGLLLNKDNQTAVVPATSNLRFNEGTWESFITPEWAGIDNDATLTFNITYNGSYDLGKIYIGSNGTHPTEMPFTLNTNNVEALGKPHMLHQEVGYFIWFDSSINEWALRVRAPVTSTSKEFEGVVTTTGEFYDVKSASTADAYDGYDGYSINEVNDYITSTDTKVKFSFVIDAYDAYNYIFDAYDAYGPSTIGGFDGINFTSDNVHYLFDTGVDKNYCRISLYKDGKGYLRFRVYDGNRHVKILSAPIHNWEISDTHHVACSWKLGTIEERDEMHLFIDGTEIPNTFRYRGYLAPPSDAIFMDTATEELLSAAYAPTIGDFDLQTVNGSDIVTSLSSTFVTDGISPGTTFVILDNTIDGIYTQNNIVTVLAVLNETQLQLDYTLQLSLSDVQFSINPLKLSTVSDNDVERVRVFVSDAFGNETELYPPGTLTPQYNFETDGYLEYVNVYDGVGVGNQVLLRSYGLMQTRCRQYVYIWPDLQTNILNTIMPQPTAVSKINITSIIVRRLIIDPGVFTLVATSVGGHIIPIFSFDVPDFCQPSNSITGRLLSVTASGENINWSGLNQVIITGDTTDGYDTETLIFNSPGTVSTTRYFTEIDNIFVAFSPIDSSKPAGVIEIRETHPLNWQENGGDYAEVHLSIQRQAGINGTVSAGGNSLTDAYARFGAENIGDIINIISPAAIAGTYTVTDVPLDPSGTVKDSNTAILNSTWPIDSNVVVWRLLTTSYGDSGFANGLITLETARSGGQPFLLRSCWYEVDFPTYLNVYWPEIPNILYIGSDMDGTNQAAAVIDEMRILDELSVDTGKGEAAPSSGRSITTDALVVDEFSNTTQTLGLFHFNDDVINSASFYASFSPEYTQSENSVNAAFGQSAIFNRKTSLAIDNKSIFSNDEGTIEFWVSPILDTYNDPTRRYYVDLSPEQTIEVAAQSRLTVVLPVRARTITSVIVQGSDTNYFEGGALSNNGLTVTLGQPLPKGAGTVIVQYIPITSQGDRFSIYKNEDGFLTLYVSASSVEYQIRVPIYWKKNSWHRIFVGWDLNNPDNQDRLIMMVDGVEAGTIRYGTGLLYGSGHIYGSPTVWGSASAGTTAARNILADINLTDLFNTIHIGADFTGQFPSMARIDNLRISSELRSITYLGGSGPGQSIGRDIFYTSNLNTAQPVISDALTRLLLDFNTDQTEVEYLATVRSMATGIFDFFVEVIDTFELADTDLIQQLITDLIERLKPAHTRAFVSFVK